MEKFKKDYFNSGLWAWWVIILIFLYIIFSIFQNANSNSVPTPEPGYTGKCHHWLEARKWANQETCIWGFPTSTATGSWVWLHFSEQSYPFPDFAADIDDYYGGDVKFTANNIAEKYVGHCVEIYGKVIIESNTYYETKTQQPVIHVNSANDIKICDNKLINSP